MPAERTVPEQPKRRGKGRPFTKGDPRINKAGRPPGRRAKIDEMLANVGTSSPLETLLTIMHTTKSEAVRLKAAGLAAPYCHPRLVADVGGLGNTAQGDDKVEVFTLNIFDPHNGPRVRRVLPPPDGGEQEGRDDDPI